MMYKLINKIDNVLRYVLHEKQLIYSSEKESGHGIIRKIDLLNNKLIIEKSTNSTLLSFITSRDCFLGKDISGNGLMMDYFLDVLFEIPLPFKIGENHLITSYISIYQGRIKNREFGIYNIPTNKILWMSGEQNALETFGDNLFGQSDFELYRSDPISGDILWRIDLRKVFAELSNVKGGLKLLGLHNSFLIATFENTDRLLALDIGTGSLKWERQSFPSLDCLDIKKGVVHSISSSYCRVDANTGKDIDSFIDREYFKSRGILSQRNNYAIDGDHLITTDHQKGVIGAFNTMTHKFDWIHEAEGVSFPSPNPIILEEAYLAILDNFGSLHVFEKNEL